MHEERDDVPAGDGYETRQDAVAGQQSESAYEADYAAVEEGVDPGDASTRATLLPEEQAVGSDDPQAQAQAILEESLMRTEVPGAAPDTHLEHRHSEDTI